MILNWIFLALLALIGLALMAGGGLLVYLGGSPYYLLSGITAVAVAVLILRRNARAIVLYGALCAGTLLWSIYESQLHFLGLLPRLAMWVGFGGWLLTPWFRAFVTGDREDAAAPLPVSRWWFGAPAIASVLVLLFASAQGYERAGSGTVRLDDQVASNDDWRHYGNTEGGTRFATLDDINVSSVGDLTEVWRYRTGVEEDFKATPLNIDGRLYFCAARNVLIAIDDASGEEIWRFDPGIEPPMDNQYALTCRGVAYHEAPGSYKGQCPSRIVTATVNAKLIAVNAENGELCSDFGDNGLVDLWEGLGDQHEIFEYWVTSSPLLAGDNLVVGGQVTDTQDMGLPSGVVRAFNAISGELSWAWDLGNPENTGFPEPGKTYTPGTPNVWSIMSYDPELNLIYAPTGNPAPDYYGGARRDFDEAYSSSVVAIDATTGVERWKYQTVHHDVWDYDVPAQPVLVDVRRDGELVPSVAVPTKMGDIFLLDRRDGEPVFPTPEKPVPQFGAIDGERLSPTQPDSPLPDFHPYRYERDMWGLTPIDQMVCRIEYRTMNYDGMYTPPSLVTGITQTGTMLYPGNFGGFNWGSVSVDADNGLLVAAPMMLAHRLSMVTPQQVAEAGPIARLLLGPKHPAVRISEDGPMPAMGEPDSSNPYDHRQIKAYGYPAPFMSRLGTAVPCFEPPWSMLAVIDLNTNMLLWKRPVGDMSQSGPFNIRSGLPFDVGSAIRAGTLTTRGGLTFISSTMDAKVRAFDLRTGKEVWEAELPGNGLATPMTYRSQQDGRQYLIVTVPNPTWRYPRDPATNKYIDSKSQRDGKGGYVIAYALPD